MSPLATLYFGSLALSGLTSAVLVALAWGFRARRGSHWLLALAVLIAELTVTSAMEPLSSGLGAKEAWVNAQYIAYLGLPLVYLGLVLQHCGYGQLLTRRNVLLLLLVPVLAQVAAWTNGLHHLMRSDLHPAYVADMVFLGKVYGPLNWASIGYSYLLSLASLVVLGWFMASRSRVYWGQAGVLMVGVALPLCCNFAYVARLWQMPYVDFLPPVSSLSAMLLAYSILRLHLLRVLPVARGRIIESMRDGVLVIDTEGRIIDLNPAATSLLGVQAADLLGVEAAEALQQWPEIRACATREALSQRVEVTLEQQGALIACELRLSPLVDQHGHRLGCLMLLQDISARKADEAMIRHLAYHDSLTDLPNRKLFMQRVEEELARATRQARHLALLMLDLDGFKEINDTLGHHSGDEALREVARRLRQIVREGDVLCRMGGDEFLVLQTDISSREAAEALARRIKAAIGRPMEIGGVQCIVAASIGIALFPEGGATPEALLHVADAAMYAEKRANAPVAAI